MSIFLDICLINKILYLLKCNSCSDIINLNKCKKSIDKCKYAPRDKFDRKRFFYRNTISVIDNTRVPVSGVSDIIMNIVSIDIYYQESCHIRMRFKRYPMYAGRETGCIFANPKEKRFSSFLSLSFSSISLTYAVLLGKY